MDFGEGAAHAAAEIAVGGGYAALPFGEYAYVIPETVSTAWRAYHRAQGITLNNIGEIFKDQGSYGEALKHFEESLDIQREIGFKIGEGAALNNIALIYDVQGAYDKALKYLEKSLDISREIGNQEGLVAILCNMGRQYIENKNDMEKGMPLLMEAYKTACETGDAKGIFHTSKYLGEIKTREGKKNDGLGLLMTALSVGTRMRLPQMQDVDAFIKEHFTEEEIKAFVEKQKEEE